MNQTRFDKELFRLFDAHPKCKALRKSGGAPQLLRQIIDVAPQQLSHNFVTGTIANSACLRAQPVALVDRDHGVLLAAYYLGPGSNGHPGYAHGGLMSTIMDECCGKAAACLFQVNPAVSEVDKNADNATERNEPSAGAATITITVNYKSPLPVDSIVFIEAAASMTDHRKALVKAQMWHLDKEGDLGREVATASARFVRAAALQARM